MRDTEVEVPEPDYDDPKEVYAFYGLAAYAAQVLERGLVNLLVGLSIAGERGITVEVIDGLFEQFNSHTFGHLFKALRNRISVTAGLEGQLSDALLRRNLLVHQFFEKHSEDFISEKGRHLMIDELRELIVLFKSADQSVDDLTLPLFSKLGITAEIIQRGLDAMQAAATARDEGS